MFCSSLLSSRTGHLSQDDFTIVSVLAVNIIAADCAPGGSNAVLRKTKVAGDSEKCSIIEE